MTTGSVKHDLRLLLGGDVMLGRLVNKVMQQQGAHYPLADLMPLRVRADLFFVNLECAITARTSRFAGQEKAFYFRADPIAIETLASARVNAVSLANNHVLDADSAGLLDTLDHLAAAGIVASGAGRNLIEAEKMAVIEFKNTRVGLIACCDHQPDFAATVNTPGIFYLDLRELKAQERLLDIAANAALDVDHLVVSLHWLSNWVRTIPRYAARLAERLCDAGARIVWGHSPHHLLGTRRYGTGIILYSTGDLVDDYAVDPWFRNDRQLVYEIELTRGDILAITAWPVQLSVGHTRPADADVAGWFDERVVDCNKSLGTHAARSWNGGFSLVPTHGEHRNA